MLRAPPWKASAMPSPMMMRGTDRTRVAEVSAYQEPNAPCQRAPSAATASYPAKCSLSASSSSPKPSAATEPLARTGHHQLADPRPSRTGLGGEHGAPGQHDDSMGQPEDLIQIAGVHQHGRPGSRCREQPGVDL